MLTFDYVLCFLPDQSRGSRIHPVRFLFLTGSVIFGDVYNQPINDTVKFSLLIAFICYVIFHILIKLRNIHDIIIPMMS